MASIITKVLKQDAVYWPTKSNGPNSDGRDAYGAPIAVRVRWEDKTEEIILQDGVKTVSKAQVMISRDVVVGGILMLGTLASLRHPARPLDNEGASRIIMFEKIPDFKARQFLRIAYL